MNDIEDTADNLDGDLNPVQFRHRRRNKSSVGKTACLPVPRQVEFIVQAILHGRMDSATARAILSGPESGAVRFGVWRRARRNPLVALALDDEWKREAKLFRKERA